MSKCVNCVAAALAVLGLLPTPGAAQSYPAKSVKLVVGFAPGGAADFVSRTFQDALSKELGQPVIVEKDRKSVV